MSKKILHAYCLLAASLSLGAVGLAGCQYARTPDYNTREVTIKDLIGTWEPTQETIAEMKTRGGYPISSHQLVLRANGTFSMVNMPDCVLVNPNSGWDSSHEKLKSGTGKWQIQSFPYEGSTVWDKGLTTWDVGFVLDNGKLGTLPSGSGPSLISRNNAFLLHFSFGDADFGHAVEFERKMGL